MLKAFEVMSRPLATCAPEVNVTDEVTPALYNDPKLTERVARSLGQALGDSNIMKAYPVMASEDFGYWGLNREIPTCMFWLGASDPAQYRQSQLSGVPIPSHHSPLFAPLPEPTIRTGVKATAAAVLDLLGT